MMLNVIMNEYSQSVQYMCTSMWAAFLLQFKVHTVLLV